MILLAPHQTATLRSWFLPDRPGPLVGLHVITTGNGACFVDRWPEPRAAFIATTSNGSLVGQPDAQFLEEMRGVIAHFVDAPEDWDVVLQSTFPDQQAWDRVIFTLPRQPQLTLPTGTHIRRLTLTDASALWALSSATSWIGKTWGGPAGLAASGMAWGAFIDTRVVTVACSFFVGDQYEDIGVATEPAFRGRGLSTVCTAGLCNDIRARGRIPSWTTSPDNQASIRVAEKLGFIYHRPAMVYPIGIPVPAPAKRSDTTA